MFPREPDFYRLAFEGMPFLGFKFSPQGAPDLQDQLPAAQNGLRREQTHRVRLNGSIETAFRWYR